MRKWHLVAYDVRDDGRLRQVARLLEGYGDRIQYSVFRCRLTDTELERLRWELARIVSRDDSVLIVPLCEHCAAGVRDLHRRKHWDDEWVPFRVV